VAGLHLTYNKAQALAVRKVCGLVFGLHLMRDDACVWPEALDRLSGNLCLALADVPPAEQELAVEVAGLDCVQVDLAPVAYLISPGR